MTNIIRSIESRDAFKQMLSNNPGMIILKLGATWCGPCRQIEQDVHTFFHSLPQNGTVLCGDIDIDNSTDFYSYLRSNKRVNGIPVILCYVRGQHHGIVPTCSITGADKRELHRFFLHCKDLMN